MSTRERVDIDSCEDDESVYSSSSEDSANYEDANAALPLPTGRPARYDADAASADSSEDDYNFTDAGWRPIRKQQDAEAEKRELAILPPTPHQLEMAEAMAAEKYANHRKKHTLKVKALLKKASSRSNNNKHSGSSDDGTEAVEIPTLKSKLKGLGSSKAFSIGQSSRSNRSFGSDHSIDNRQDGSNHRRDGDSHSPPQTPIRLAQEVMEKTRRAFEQQDQQMQWKAPPSNTVSVKCSHLSAVEKRIVMGKVQKFIPKNGSLDGTFPLDSKDSYALPDDSINNSFRPLLLIASKRKAHKGTIFVMKFSPHGGHFLATGGEDGKVCVWQVAPDVNDSSRKSECRESKGNNRKADASPDRFVAGAKEREDEVEGMVAPLRTTTNTLAEDASESCRVPKIDNDIITHEGGSMPIGNDIMFLSNKPLASFRGHTAEVVDLAWSQQPPPFVPGKRNKKKKRHEPFLLTASLDKTVRLWHISRPDAPLHIFQHADMVTCVDFHPTNDSYFVSGGFDSKLRLWSIANGRVKAYAQCPDIITSAKFTPDTFMVAAGLMKGQVFFYMTDSMKYYTQIDSKNRRGKKSEGCKVTGLTFHTVTTQQPMSKNIAAVEDLAKSLTSTDLHHSAASANTVLSSNDPESTVLKTVSRDLLLVSTNDSRLRLYDLDGYGAIQKFKGLKNDQMQIKAHFCESGDFIVCGSESGSVHIWENNSGVSKTSSTTAKGAATAARAVAKLKATSHKGIGDRSSPYATFDGCPRKHFKEKEKLAKGIPKEICGTGDTPSNGAVTEAIFAPSQSVKEALLACDLFRSTLNSSTMDRIPYDFSSAFLVAGDNEGSLRIFIKRSCLDTVIRASGPEGLLHGTPPP